MRERDSVIAVLCADIHLSNDPPRCRRKEPNWFEAMHRAIGQIKTVASHYDAPILCAGDIFDHWKASPELINFALNHLPEMYAIPGQHDLPLHNIDLLHRSAFWTLALAGKIHPVLKGEPVMAENNLVLHGFPFGCPLKPLDEPTKKFHVALVHDYFWKDSYKYKKAPQTKHSSNYSEKIQGYHAVVFGDNHQGFQTEINGISVLNCGGLMRRSVDEKDRQPHIGLLCKSGQIHLHPISIHADKFQEKEDISKKLREKLGRVDLENYIYAFAETTKKQFDFLQAAKLVLDGKPIKTEVKQIILEALGLDE